MRERPSDLFEKPFHSELPVALLNGSTGIEVIDKALVNLMEHGVMHNHERMWIASIACNIAKTQWPEAAKWMHYHLLDGDLASNTLSWQWVAGTFSNKRYLANQENINKYSKRSQEGTFLDCSYETLATIDVPVKLKDRQSVLYFTEPPGNPIQLNPGPVAIHSIWNLDSAWRTDINQHILFVDDDFHRVWPMSVNRWQFIQHWAQKIPNLTIMRGTAGELQAACEGRDTFLQEYPACRNWAKVTDERPWLFQLPSKPFNSFFAFWNQVKKSV